MNKNIQKTVVFLASLCMLNFAMAMDLPQLEHPKEPLTTVIRILKKEGRKAAIEFLEHQGNDSASKKILKALKDPRKLALLNATNNYWLEYVEQASYSLEKEIYIEKISDLLSENLQLMSNAFYRGNSFVLFGTIMELEDLRKVYSKRKPFREFELDIRAKWYDLILNGHNELSDRQLFNNDDHIEENDDKFFNAITKILLGIENNLHDYCINNFFHIWVQYYDHYGDVYEWETSSNDIAAKIIKNLPSLKNIIRARQKINRKIMALYVKESLERADFIKISNIINLSVDFLEDFSQQIAVKNVGIIKYIREEISNHTDIHSENLWPASEGSDALSRSFQEPINHILLAKPGRGSSSSDGRQNRFNRPKVFFKSMDFNNPDDLACVDQEAFSNLMTFLEKAYADESSSSAEQEPAYHYGLKGTAERELYEEEMKYAYIPEETQNSRRWSLPSLINLVSRPSKNVPLSDSKFRSSK